MAYSEELDIIQNMKNLSNEVSEVLDTISLIQPSIAEILSLKDQFNNLSSTTLDIINRYENELSDKSNALTNLLISARSQFKQVTDDVEALVNLEVDFESIKNKILACLDLSNTLADFLQGATIKMDRNNIISLEERKPYKRYLEVISTTEIREE